MKKATLLLIIFLSMVSGLIANHNAGAELTYRHVAGDSFDIILKIYRDCSGINPPPVQPIQIKTACTSYSKNPVLFSTRDLTGIPQNCATPSKCSGSSGSYGFGYEEAIYKVRIRIGGDTCCNYTFSYNTCCRIGAINTGPAYTVFHLEAKYNKCLAPFNSSPEILADPTFLLPVGQDVNLFFTATDTINNDSVTYAMVPLLEDPGVTVPYSGSWAYNKPFTFFGFPNASSPKPQGFYFDSLTGQMSFRPTVVNEGSPYVVRVYEWRKISNVWTLIGQTSRELIGITINANNNLPPKITSISGGGTGNTNTGEIVVCNNGGSFCTDITLEDTSSATDSIFFNFKHTLKNISFTNVGTVKKPIIRVCYFPDSAELASGKTIKFLMEAYDDICPIPAKTEKVFTLKIGPHLPDSFAISKTLNCRELKLQAINSSSLTQIAYSWTIQPPTSPAYSITATAYSFGLTEIGWYKFALSVKSSVSNVYCNVLGYTDSVYIGPERFISASAGNDTSVCFDSVFVIIPKITNGKAPFDFFWNDSSKNSTNTVNLQPGLNKYWVKIIDTNNCIAEDTVIIKLYNPSLTLSGDTAICSGDTAAISSVVNNAINPVYKWTGFANTSAGIFDRPSASRQYELTVTDSAGCEIQKQWNVNVYNPTIQITRPMGTCSGDSITLTATTANGLQPHSILWSPFGFNTNSIKVAFTVTSITYLKFSATVTDGLGCANTATDSVLINPIPVITLTSPGTVCESSNNINLSTYASPTGGQWSGTQVSGNAFSPLSAGPGNYVLKYNYTSPAGCSNSDSTTIEVEQKPIANFTVDKIIGSYTETFNFTNTSVLKPFHISTWNFGDPGSGTNNIVVANNASHQFSDTGLYTVKLLVSGGACSPDSMVKTNYIRVTGKVSAMELFNNIANIYPNPATKHITIETTERISKIQITDVIGNVLNVKSEIEDNKIICEINNLPDGLYIISIETGDGTISTARFIVRK